MYGAWEDEVYLVNQSGTVTAFSTLSGSDYPSFGRNSKAAPDIAVVTDNGAFIINTTAGAVQNYPDADVSAPGTPQCCCGYMGFIWFGYANGQMQVTKFNSTDISTLDQANTITNHDGIKAIFGWSGQIYAMGANTVEVWGEPINATGFPLTRVGFNITPGIIGKRAYAGWEQEWGHPPCYVGSDGTVRQLQGYQAVKISNTDLERDIRNVSFNDHDDITCLVYNTGGNAFWQVNLPTKTWVYHVNERTWHQRKSQGSGLSKLVNSVFFSDRWVVGDTDSNAVYYMDLNTHDENGEELVAQMESGPLKQFPNRQRITRADFDFSVGVGVTTGTDPEQTDPQVQIEVSYDGGHTWPHSWNRKLGKEGKYFTRVFVNNPGITGDEGARWRWSISDPVRVGFQGGDMVPAVLAK
jgi:hypothetical protein